MASLRYLTLEEVVKKWLINFRRKIKFKFVRKSVTIKQCEISFYYNLYICFVK